MKPFYTCLLIASVPFFCQFLIKPISSNPEDIIGSYWSPQKDAKIEIFKKGDRYFGKFIWLAKPRKDINNPIPGLQSREIVGMEFLTGFAFKSGEYANGEVYDPETGNTYSCKMHLEGERLKVRGYVGVSLFGRTEYFEKIKTIQSDNHSFNYHQTTIMQTTTNTIATPSNAPCGNPNCTCTSCTCGSSCTCVNCK